MGTKILWRPIEPINNVHQGGTSKNGSDKTTYQRHNVDEEREFHRVRNLQRMEDILKSQNNNDDDDPPSLTITAPPHRPLIDLVSQSLVVGQEFSLTVILLAVHREIVDYEESQDNTWTSSPNQLGFDMSNNSSLTIPMLIVYLTLFIIVYYNRQSSTKNDQKQQRRKRAIVRLSDGLLLAALLRFVSGVLRSLTASYSTDTVYALAISGMVIHLLACDYKYANGVLSDDTVGEGNSTSSFNASSSSAHPRPPFFGGTVSLNAAFFSTVLLVSRIKSNASSYAFVSSVVTMFAFYPASRHNISGSYPNTIGGSPCFIITLALSLTAWILLSSFEKVLFAIMQLLVFVISPSLQWGLQRHKQIITGPWDIAHIRVQS